jgi:hypothetical protein
MSNLLTEEEIKQISDDAFLSPNIMDFARAIESAKREGYEYAKLLAETMFAKHYASDPEYASGEVVWSACDNLSGVLTQIDNMLCGLVRQREQSEPVVRVNVFAPVYGEKPRIVPLIDLATLPLGSHDLYAAPQPERILWKPLTDVQWMNIVNHEHAWESHSKEDAVHGAVKMVEAQLRLNNAPQPAPEGMVLVPRKMTVAVGCAWKDAMDAGAKLQEMWDAMIAAAEQEAKP